MKLSEWAKSQGISYKTAWRWFHQGKLPVPAEQIATGTILIKSPKSDDKTCVVYARVSSQDKQSELDRQVARIVKAVTEQELTVSKIVMEIASGSDESRSKLLQLLSDPSIKRIAIEHKDRLMRFGYEYIESALQAQGRQLIAIDKNEHLDDLVEDIRGVLTSFCARFYSKSVAKNKAKKVLEMITKDV